MRLLEVDQYLGRDLAVGSWPTYPDSKLSRTSLQIGAAVIPYFIRNKKSTYRVADGYIATGLLHFVPDTPDMPYPAFAVWLATRQQDLINNLLSLLDRAAQEAPLIKLSKRNARSDTPHAQQRRTA